MYLSELFYCTLHLTKSGENVTGKTCYLNIMRNSDRLFLNTEDGSFGDVYDIELTETTDGIYQFELNMKDYSNIPDSYTLIYKYELYQFTEQLYYQRKNRSKLV